MKILYGLQATGNGHIARAKELLPFLKLHANVDVFLSGDNSSLHPGFEVKFRSKGLSFYYNKSGGLDYRKTVKHFRPWGIWKEAHELPVKKYDLVISDFESISSLAARLKRVPVIAVGHQSSFLSPFTPRPAHPSRLGEWVLRHYAPASAYIGLHFKKYDNFIFEPVIKESIKKARVSDMGHVTVYLPHFSDVWIRQQLLQCPQFEFEIFSPHIVREYQEANIRFYPINNEKFTKSVLSSHGVITGAGFETPAETLYLGKRLMCIPIGGQYEQLCNAAALESFGVTVVAGKNFGEKIENWATDAKKIIPVMSSSNAFLAEKIMETAFGLLPQNRQPSYSFF